MRLFSRVVSVVAALSLWLGGMAAETNPQAVRDLLNRIGGNGAADRFETVLDESIATNGKETFVLTSSGGKPCIKGSTLSALTAGIGWYLNHHANINLAWNCPKVDLVGASLPLPAEETHSSDAVYRYYLNYCTFSYSMSTWTWDRWQEEIDWMALRGVNMPLQIIGLEEVWRKFLMEDYGYSKAEANAFVGGPCFMAWFGMNNLEGWGGPNPNWWYERQAQLGLKISERMRSLGIEPVLPGFAGMVPSNFTSKTGIAASSQGKWCGFQRPYIVDSTGDKFSEVAAKYYKRLNEVMGESKYYSLDPYHEGGAAPANPGLGYQKMNEALHAAKSDAKWVIQAWQWSNAQRTCLTNIPKGELIVLDLYSDGRPAYRNYNGHETVYSTIFNFGGRTGFFGRVQKVIDGYFDARTVASVKGIGAAPEAIEQTPIMYDLLFELAWLDSKPDAKQWVAEYANRRYSADNADAREAWELLRTSALDCQSDLQGPHEAIMCGRPALNINKVSSWGGSVIFYDQNKTAAAAYKLLNSGLSGNNYDYDLVDLVRQAVTDYSKSLLGELNRTNAAGDTQRFNQLKEAFLELMLGVDELLCTHPDFMLGHWTERSRAIADEVSGTTGADRDWLELNNARTLITTWGPQGASEGGGLRDYSYRQWGGMVKDFYYARWKKWFDEGMKGQSWFQWEWNWAHNNPDAYHPNAVGDTREVASRLLPKYLSPFTPATENATPYYVPRMMSTDVSSKVIDKAGIDSEYLPNFVTPGTQIAEIAIDFNKSNTYDDSEKSTDPEGRIMIPADAPIGERKCRITLADGTVFTYTLGMIIDITEPRTVTVKTSDATKGSVSIVGSDALSVTNTDVVTLLATPTLKYDFDHWENKTGTDVGNDNPLKYYDKADEDFTAYFRDNIWGVPGWAGGTFPPADMATYGQYLVSLGVTQGGEETTFFESTEAPSEHFYYVSNRIKAAPGGAFHFNYQGKGSMEFQFLSAYCDLNADGKFDVNTNELLGTKGTHNTKDASVGKGGFDVLLPYDTPTGTTHIRLRFDGAWLDTENGRKDTWVKLENHPSGATGAYRPDAVTNRIIYEVLLEVNNGVEYNTTVTVKSGDENMGTVRSENSTNVYLPGERVILTAFPEVGFRLAHWEDSYGRALPAEWMDGNTLTFTAFDNADITAVFERTPVEIDLWQLEVDTDENGLTFVDKVISEGEPHLNFSSEHSAIGGEIDYIRPGVFAGWNALREVTLPDQQMSMTAYEDFYNSGTLNGQATQIQIEMTKPDGTAATKASPYVDYTDPFRMTISGVYKGTSYNDSGCVLFANGTNGLAAGYANGWSRILLNKAGTIDVWWDSNSPVNFPVTITSDFTINIDYLGNNKTLFTVINGEGDKVSKIIENSTKMMQIWHYAVYIPSGMTETISFARAKSVAQIPGEVFAGCRNLMDIHVSDACDYAVEKKGVVYDKTGVNCIAYPEGRILGGAFSLVVPGSTNELSAAPLSRGGEMTNLGISAVARTDNWNTLWTIDQDGSLVHYNSGLGVDNTGHALSSDDAVFSYALVYDEGEPSISFSNEAGMYMTATGLMGNPYLFDFYPVYELTVPAGDLRTVTFPVNVIVPEGAEVFSLDKVGSQGGYTSHIMPGHIIPAGTGVLIKGEVAPFEITTQASAETPDLLDGTNVDLELDTPYYVLNGEYFVRQESGTVAANTGYVPAEVLEVAQFRYQPADYSPVEIDGWKFDWRESYSDNVICLTAAIEPGNPNLDLSNPIEESGYRVVDIDPAMFQNHSELYEVTLPAQRLAHHYYNSHVEGVGSQGPGDVGPIGGETRVLNLPQTLSGNTPWKLTIEASSNGTGANKWGTGLFATGTNPIAGSYPGGFQLYLQNNSNRGGHIVCKYNGTNETTFSPVINGPNVGTVNNFTIVFSYTKDAGNNYSMNITISCNGVSDSKTLKFKHSEISSFCAAIPEGVNLEKLHLEGEEIFFPYNEGELFVGCTNLQNIHLAEGADYAVEKDGVLYSKTNPDQCIAYPEGRLFTRPFNLTTAAGVQIAAAPKFENGEMTETEVTVANPENQMNALWQLGENKLTHLNSGIHLNAIGSALSDVNGEYGYKVVYGEGEPTITFPLADDRHLSYGDGQLMIDAEPYEFNFNHVDAIYVPEIEGPSVASFPVNVIVPEGAEVFALERATAEGGFLRHINPGHIIPAGTGVIVLDDADGFVVTREASTESSDMLDGTTVNLVLNEPHYVLEGTDFVLRASGTVAANTGYVLAADLTVASFPYQIPGYKPVKIDGWEFDWRYSYDNTAVCLTSAVTAGEESLDLGKLTDTGKTVVDIDPALFLGNKDLYEVTLPDTQLGRHFYDSSLEGAGIANHTLWLPQSLTGDKAWKMTIEASSDGSGFNQWGSGLFATGTNATATYYVGGFQLYLQVHSNGGGYIVCKYNGANETTFKNVVINPKDGPADSRPFTIQFDYSQNAAGSYKMTITVACDGKSESKTLDFKHSEIKSFCASIPKGVNIDKLHLEGADFLFPYTEGELFAGCSNMMAFHVSDNCQYAVEKDGVLYSKSNPEKCIAYPENRLFTRPFILTTATGEHIAAAPVLDNGQLTETDVKVANADNQLNALWRLGENKLTHLNSGIHLNYNGGALSDAHGEYGYRVVYGEGEPAIAFSLSEDRHLNHSNGQLTIDAEPHSFSFGHLTTVSAPETDGPAVVTFPIDVIVPEGARVKGVSSISDKGAVLFNIAEGTTIPAGHAVMTVGGVNGFIPAPEYAVMLLAGVEDNLLRGTNVAIRHTEPYYQLEGENFVRHDKGVIPANSAYIPADELDVEQFPYDASTTELIEVEAGRPDEMYDLMGRRVSKAARTGVYIVNGKAVRL